MASHRRFPHASKTHRGLRHGGPCLIPVRRLEFERGSVVERRMQALAVVDLLDEGRDAAARLGAVAVQRAVDFLGLERLDEALGLGVLSGQQLPVVRAIERR